MKLSRSDVRTDKRQVICQNSSWLGFSSNKLRPGMFFTYRDGEQIKLAKMHYRIAVDPRRESTGFVVAQVAAASMAYTMERYVNPSDVTETIPANRMHAGIVAFFDYQEAQQ